MLCKTCVSKCACPSQGLDFRHACPCYFLVYGDTAGSSASTFSVPVPQVDTNQHTGHTIESPSCSSLVVAYEASMVARNVWITSSPHMHAIHHWFCGVGAGWIAASA